MTAVVALVFVAAVGMLVGAAPRMMYAGGIALLALAAVTHLVGLEDLAADEATCALIAMVSGFWLALTPRWSAASNAAATRARNSLMARVRVARIARPFDGRPRLASGLAIVVLGIALGLSALAGNSLVFVAVAVAWFAITFRLDMSMLVTLSAGTVACAISIVMLVTNNKTVGTAAFIAAVALALHGMLHPSHSERAASGQA